VCTLVVVLLFKPFENVGRIKRTILRKVFRGLERRSPSSLRPMSESKGTITAFFGTKSGGKNKRALEGAEENGDAAKKKKKTSQEESVEAASVDVTVSSTIPVAAAASLDGFRLETGWEKWLAPEMKKSRWNKLIEFLRYEEDVLKKAIFPPKPLVFSAFNTCPFEKVKVVILGQDPYHGPGQAHGLSFSVQKGVATPPSLRNIFKEAMDDVGIKKPSSGDLTPWAEQGVLLLNNVLTVRKGEAHSHKGKGWEEFTSSAIATLNRKKQGLVFLLWGKPAQEKGSIVDRHEHHVITSSHPSPLGASKTSKPFLGSKCFSRCNNYLKQQGLTPIDWSLP